MGSRNLPNVITEAETVPRYRMPFSFGFNVNIGDLLSAGNVSKHNDAFFRCIPVSRLVELIP